MHYLVVTSDILAQFVIAFAYLEGRLEDRFMIKMEPNDPVTKFDPSHAANEASAGPHVEGCLVKHIGNISYVGGGCKVQGLEFPMDRSQHFRIVIHHQHAVLMPPFNTDRVPHSKDNFLQTSQNCWPSSKIVTKLHKSIHNGHREKVTCRFRSLLQQSTF